MPAPSESNDLELLALARNGDQSAYGQLVARHQTLVVSLAYSICGDFARSQDLAQETFIAAWRQLATLEDAAKFKGWLCGIVRNLGNNFIRQQNRREDRPDATLSATAESVSEAPGPHEHAVTREESTIVWRALEELPETYREPLILFYREHQSVERVAAALDLSEDTVKQRLTRGRAMLRDQVENLVERSLGFTTPGVMFTTAVLSALPVAATQIAATTMAAAAAKGGAVSKGAGILPWLWSLATPFLLIPFISILGTAIQSRLIGRYVRSPEERKFQQRQIWSMGWVSALCVAAMLGFSWWQTRQYRNRTEPLGPTAFALVLLGLVGVSVLAPLLIYLRGHRRSMEWARAFQIPEDASRWRKKMSFIPRRALAYRSRLVIFGLPLLDIRFGHSAEEPLVRGTAVGWVALGDIAHGVVFALGGFAVGGIAVGGVAIGALSSGYLAVGLVAVGGVAVGGLAKGILVAFGYIALGTVAVGWESASGAVSVARHIASGMITVAQTTTLGATQGSWEETNPIVRTFKPNTILALALPAILNAVIAMVAVNALARQRRDQTPRGDSRRFASRSVFLGVLSVAVVGYALVFNAAVARTARRIAAEIETVNRAKARFEQARKLARTGQRAEALAEFVGCLDDGMTRERNFGDTISIFSGIEELSRTYPPAKATLRERRDRAEAAVRTGHAGHDGIDDVGEVVILNRLLGEAQRSRALYDQLPSTHGLRSSLGHQLNLDH